MNSGPQTNTANGQAPASGMNLDDVLYTLFRRKWIIAGSVVLGVLAVCFVRVMRPPSYRSQAQLMIHYVEERSPTVSSQDSRINSPDAGSAGLLNTEKELLKSLDLATNVAAMVGPKRLLLGKGDDLMAAAGVVGNGIAVEVPQATPILTISFKHRDKNLVQDAVNALVEAYKQKHQEVHGGGGAMDEFNRKHGEAMRLKLSETEAALRKIRTNSNLLSVEQTKQTYQAEIAKWQEELHSSQVELDSRKAVLGDAIKTAAETGSTNTSGPTPPQDKIREYADLSRQIAHLRGVKQELLLQYREAFPTVKTAQEQLDKLITQKGEMEKAFPSLAHIELGSSGTNSAAGELGEIQKLTARVASLTTLLSNLTAAASHVMELEPIIADLQRQRDLEETNYYRWSEAWDRQKIALEMSGGKPVNITTIEQPTPPSLDSKKLMKMLGGAFGGCVAMGLGLAFLLDFLLDRTLRRPIEVQRHLKQGVFLTIPDVAWQGPAKFPGFRPKLTNGANGHENGSGSQAVDRWQPQQALAVHTAGLRERVITYFEINGMNHKKPKLVGVTGCHKGAGVSSLANGLALSLSETSDGNVLVVDLNRGDGVAKVFRHGQPAADIAEVLSMGEAADAPGQASEYIASNNEANHNPLAVGHPSRLGQLVPHVRASEYDYIVFDMPPVSPTTSTPRLSGHMDLVLMVLESEKTGQQPAVRANALLHESHAKVVTILNKYRAYVPAHISQEM